MRRALDGPTKARHGKYPWVERILPIKGLATLCSLNSIIIYVPLLVPVPLLTTLCQPVHPTSVRTVVSISRISSVTCFRRVGSGFRLIGLSVVDTARVL